MWIKTVFVIFFLATISVGATMPQQEFLRQFQSSRISFPDESSPLMADHPGRYSLFLRFFFENIFSWSPTGASSGIGEKCASDLWGNRLKDPRIARSAQLQGALIQKYFRDCSTELENGTKSDVVNMAKMMSIELDSRHHPFWRQVVFNLPGNIKLKGLLALKGDFKKRPLVVMRLGVYSDVQQFLPERPWLMMLFEQAPFNVLVLESMSGADFIANNSKFSFGGYDEGIQNILVGQILKDPNEPISHLVESLHLFGVSLGGHGVFYGSLLNSLNSPKGQPLYQSFMAACPVVNLETTMRELTRNKPSGYFVDLWSRQRLEGLKIKMSAINEHEAFGFLDKTVSEVARTYHGGLSYVSSIKLPPGVTDSASFWELNDFWSHYKYVSEPFLVFATHKDPAVPFELNSEMIQNKMLNIQSSNIGIVDFAYGVHCTLPIPYDWKTLSTLTQSYILSHAPGFKMKENVLELEVGDYAEKLKLRYLVRRPEPKDKFIKVEVKIEGRESEPAQEMSLNLPLAEFDFRFLNEELSPSEQSMIERWVNQNLHLSIVEKNKKAILKTSWSMAI